MAVRPRLQSYHPILLALLFVTAVKQIVLVFVYPPFQGHDEVAHLGYVWLLATQYRLPTLVDILPNALSPYSRFTLDWPALYTANHPPLYYLLAWPAYQMAGSTMLAKLYAVRLVAVPLFLLTVWLSYRLAMAIDPTDPLLVLGVPAVIAFQPQLSFEGAIVNNDMLTICIGCWLLWQSVLAVREGLSESRALNLGLGVGLGLLTKATLTAMLPVVAIAVVYACWPRPWDDVRTRSYWRTLLARAGCLVVPAALLPLPWYLYLHHTYGDFTAFTALDTLQAAWGAPAGSVWKLALSPCFHLDRLQEAWGYFGWKLIPLNLREMELVTAGLLVIALGLLVGLARLGLRWRWDCLHLNRRTAAAIGLLAISCLLLYGAMIYFGTKVAFTQARYLFPIFPAGAVVGLLGVRQLVPSGRTALLTSLLVACVAAVYVLVLVQDILPYTYLH